LFQFVRESGEVMRDEREAKNSRELGHGNRTSRSEPIRVVFVAGVGPFVPEHLDLNDVAITSNLNSVRQQLLQKSRKHLLPESIFGAILTLVAGPTPD
jgi:hypothetical protein